MSLIRIAVILGFAFSTVSRVPTTRAQSDDTYNIFAFGDYCSNGSTVFPSCPGGEAYYADAEAYGTPGATSGTPSVYVECDHYHTVADGHTVDSSAYLNSADPVGKYAITYGTAALGPNPSETNTASTGKQNYVSRDRTHGVIAIVAGAQVANNVSDQPVSGGFSITLIGTIHNYEWGVGPLPDTSGTVSCTTAKINPKAGYSRAENEFEPDLPGDFN